MSDLENFKNWFDPANHYFDNKSGGGIAEDSGYWIASVVVGVVALSVSTYLLSKMFSSSKKTEKEGEVDNNTNKKEKDADKGKKVGFDLDRNEVFMPNGDGLVKEDNKLRKSFQDINFEKNEGSVPTNKNGVQTGQRR